MTKTTYIIMHRDESTGKLESVGSYTDRKKVKNDFYEIQSNGCEGDYWIVKIPGSR